MENVSPDEYEEHLTDIESGDEHVDIKHDPSAATSPTSPTSAAGKSVAKPPIHMQKRRRVTRACDECRRKKIKCDGKQPCTHCTVYSYECTYDQPSNRRRNPAPQYVENLEHRVHRAETLLHILIPNLDLNDPGIDAAVAQGWIPGAPGKGEPSAVTSKPQPPSRPKDVNKVETNLESMVRAVAQLDIDEDGNWDYHGHSSGLSFMRRMREQLGDLMGPNFSSTPFSKSRPRSQVLDSPRSNVDSPGSSDVLGDLPPKETARQFCSNALSNGAALLKMIHDPSFWTSFERLYATPMDNYTNDDHRFLPLYYSTMAVGCLFGREDTHAGYENAIQQGFTYFKAARSLMDIADCRDLMSVQAVIFMIQYMQSTAKLPACYTLVGIALRSAMRLGLHRSHHPNIDPIEAETRKRAFWTVRKMDIYIGAMLGLPQTLSDDDIDQDFPAEVDDEYITKDGILPMPEGKVSIVAAFNSHTRLLGLLQKIVRKIYPIKVSSQKDKSYTVPISAIREIEADLEEWKAGLHPAFTPSETPNQFTRVQHLLRLAYAHAQVLLYRPFLHFVTTSKRSKPVDQRAYACAASYVNVSRNVVHITTQMRDKGLLNGAFWFIMYTSFFSILSLVYFAAENPDNPTTEAVMRDAIEGKDVLASLASKSMAADRCTATLDGIFARLPPWMREGKQNPTNSKKRHLSKTTQSTTRTASTQVKQEPRSAPHDIQGIEMRAQTFPQQTAQDQNSAQIHAWQQAGAAYNDSVSNIGVGFDTPGSTTSSTLSSEALPVNYGNAAIPDVSAMMFPGGGNEPFLYPEQPLTAFESTQQQQLADGAQYMLGQTSPSEAFSQQQLDASAAALASSSMAETRDDNLEAQFFALPPYMQQRQNRPHVKHANPQAGGAGQPFALDNLTDYSSLLSQQQQYQQINNTSAPTLPMVNGIAGGWQAGNNPQAQQRQQQQPDLGGLYMQELFGSNGFNPVMH